MQGSPIRGFPSRLWFAGIVLTILAATVACMIPYSAGLFPAATPASTSVPAAPHAPPIKLDFNAPLYEEQTKELTVKHNDQTTLSVMALWRAPAGTPVSCATGFLAFTWIVRDPYPKGGEDLEILHYVPTAEGRTETIAQGSTGSGTLGYCDDIILSNKSAKDYQVEIRYASGTAPQSR